MTVTRPEPTVEAADVAAMLASYWSLEQLAELRDAVAGQPAAAGELAEILDRIVPPTLRPAMIVVNDRGVSGQPFVLFPNSQREGKPVEVLLQPDGKRVLVIPAGAPFDRVPGGPSSLAHRLYVTSVSAAMLESMGLGPDGRPTT